MNFSDITNIKNYLISLLPNLISSLLILILFYTISNVVYNYFNNSTKLKVNQEVKSSEKVHLAYYQLKIILYYIILLIGFVCVFSNFGYSSMTLLTIFGVFILAVGLSLKDLLSSFTSGIYLSIIELYKIGDYIKVNYFPSKNFDDGYVIDFNLFYTTLKNNDGKLIKIQNDKIQENIIIYDITNNTGNNIVNKTGNNIVNKTGNNIVNKTGNNIVNKTGNNIVNKTGNNIVNKTGNISNNDFIINNIINNTDKSNNTYNISNNTDNISNNTDNISNNTDNISNNTDNISNNTDNISNNTDNISNNTDNINNNTDNINNSTDNINNKI
jgi:hypothetical protein